MIYPCAMNLLNFSDIVFDDDDYRLLQSTSMIVWVIGFIFVEFGLAHWINKYVRPLLLHGTSVSGSDVALFFSMTSGCTRIVVIPILLGIALLTFASEHAMLQIICWLFMVIDPLLGIV